MKRIVIVVCLCVLGYAGFGQSYCTPLWYYHVSCGSTAIRMFNVRIVGAADSIIDTVSCDTVGYLNQTAIGTCTMNSGGTYSVTVGNSGSYSMAYQAWIDFNCDGNFDTTTECVGGRTASTGSVRSFTVYIPSSSSHGVKRLRIEAEYNYHNYPHLNPCPDGTSAHSYYYGDARDYSIIIDSPTAYLRSTPSHLSFASTATSAYSSASNLNFNASYLSPSSGSLTVTVGSNFQVNNGSSWVSSFTISYSGGAISGYTLPVRFAPTSVGALTGNVIISGGGACAAVFVPLNGTGIVSCSGTPSGGTASSSVSSASSSTSITLSVTGATSSGGISYQWEQLPSGSSTWTSISGATNTSYTFSGLSVTTSYRCTIYCSYSGMGSVSSVVTVSSVCSGTPSAGSARSSVSVASTSTAIALTDSGYSVAGGITFQWQSSPTGTSTWTNITGATNSTYSFTGISASTDYRCRVLCTYSSISTFSSLVTIVYSATCAGTPSGGTASHTSSTGCGAAGTTTLTVSGHTTVAGIALQWQSSPSGSSSWTNISGATNATTAVANPMTTTRYRCVVTCSSSAASANSTTDSITVDKISGHVGYVSVRPDTLEAKVWLIYHNTSAGTLTAIDSTTTCLDGLYPFYEFTGMGSGNYLVKARSLDYTSSVPGTGGYVPTYGNSFPIWSTASVIAHTYGSNDTMQISLGWGTVTSGPGFIGGLISSGAGKGTATDVPKANLMVFIMDTSRHVLTYTYTDTGGRYSFNNLAYGNYIIYPEDLDYTTTPSAILSLSSGAGSSTGINFRHRTTSKTIVPVSAVNLSGVSADIEPVMLFPNPASAEFTISLNDGDYQYLTISNTVGATVIQQSLLRPSTIISIKDLAPGVYFVKLTGEQGSVVKKLVKM